MKTPEPTLSRPDPSAYLDTVRQAGLGDIIAAELERRVKKRQRRRRVVTRSVISVLALTALLAWAVPYYRETDRVSVPTAERRSIALADGSRAELNAGTSLETDFRYGRRRVRLNQGEAYFAVAKDASRPFLVTTPTGEVRVTGTAFNVRVGKNAVEVTLAEGSVALTTAAVTEPVEMVPGQQAVLAVDRRPQLSALNGAEFDRVFAWRRGQIVLEGLTLADAAARFSRFHGVTIEVDPSIAALPLGGTSSLEDLGQFLDALKDTGVVRVLGQKTGKVRVLPP